MNAADLHGVMSVHDAMHLNNYLPNMPLNGTSPPVRLLLEGVCRACSHASSAHGQHVPVLRTRL